MFLLTSFLEAHIRGQINGSVSKRKEVKTPLIGSVNRTLSFGWRGKAVGGGLIQEKCLVFCCDKLALVWFHHYFIFHFPFSVRLFIQSRPRRCSKSLKNWQCDIFSHCQRSNITEITSEANVSPAPANRDCGCTSTVVDLLLLSLRSSAFSTVL